MEPVPFNVNEFREKPSDWWNSMHINVAFTTSGDPMGIRVRLPEACSPQDVNLYFMAKTRDSPGKYRQTDYCMVFEDGFLYEGSNPALIRASTGQPITFNSFYQIESFLKMLSDPNPPRNARWIDSDNEDEGGSGNGYERSRRPDDTPTPQPEVNKAPDIDTDSLTDYGAIKIDTIRKKSFDAKAFRKELAKSIIGQDEALDAVAYAVSSFVRKQHAARPLSFLLSGKPGTGKSELAKCVGKILGKVSDHPHSVVWTDMNTFTEAHSGYRLIGSPAGYVGYDDPPLFDEVLKNPYSVFIFDELDKAHPDVLKIFMAIMDEGKCAANKELSDHSRIYNFQHCIFFFTSNLDLSGKSHKIGFSMPDEISSLSYEDGAVTISYEDSAEDKVALAKSIYAKNERARQAFVGTGVLPEIASRINYFIEFKPLSDHAKIRILAKQVAESAFEYGIRLSYIAPSIMQELAPAALAEDSLTVRSFRPVIEGYLADVFAATAGEFAGETGTYELTGTLADPQLVLA